MSGCIFCSIISGKIPARILHEDEEVVAFEDNDPKAPVHVLVVPRKHIPTSLGIEASDRPLIGRLLEVGNKIAREKGVADRGFRLVMNTNPDSGQGVYHIHFHLLGGRKMHWPPG
jgi:histidine triad (HIT) family protein